MALIETKNLSKEFRVGFRMKRVLALDDLNLEVEKGEIFGYIGPNGAGKTTTLKVIMGLIYPTSGNVKIFSKDVSDINVRAEMGFLPESPYFYDYLTAKEFLDFYAQLFSLKKKERTKRIEELLDMVDLRKAKDVQLRKFSRGMLQRIGLAQALINDPQLVVLDEPMSGLDPVGRSKIRNIILRLRDQGKTVFFSTHILSDVEMICDRVGILVGGKLRASGNLHELLEDRIRSIEITASRLGDKGIEQVQRIAKRTTIRDERVLITVDKKEDEQEVLRIIRKNKGELISLIPQRESLEDLFMEELLSV
ncbi:MAG: ABC transporter ATP-binding protein [Thermodesulfobacteriota bacterium]|nr:ABC transporter ATP-binding protein [Thermodesulfobacteriota bacterium]